MTFQDGYHLGVQDCEYALKCSLSTLKQHLSFWEDVESVDDEEAGYIQALKDFEDKLFTMGEE